MTITRKASGVGSRRHNNAPRAKYLLPAQGAVHPGLIYGVTAISRALAAWNDVETLRLLRLHWPDIVEAVEAMRALQVSITVPDQVTSAQPGAKPDAASPLLTAPPRENTLLKPKLLSEASYPVPAKVSAA